MLSLWITVGNEDRAHKFYKTRIKYLLLPIKSYGRGPEGRWKRSRTAGSVGHDLNKNLFSNRATTFLELYFETMKLFIFKWIYHSDRLGKMPIKWVNAHNTIGQCSDK